MSETPETDDRGYRFEVVDGPDGEPALVRVPTEAAKVPDEIRNVARAAFAGRPPYADGALALPSDRNPWRALDDALAAVLPAHEAMVRRAYHAELFGTPEEIRQREIEAKANAKPDDPIELCERIRPGLHEHRVRAKVATAFEAVAVEMESGGWTIAADHMRHAAALARGEQP